MPWTASLSARMVRLVNGEEVGLDLAERGVRLSNGLWVREVRHRDARGHQTAILSTDYVSDLTRVAAAIRRLPDEMVPEHVRDAVWQKIRSTPGRLRMVVCDLSASPVVDLAGARMLMGLQTALQAAGIRLRLAAAHAPVRDILRAEGLEERVGYFGRRISVADAIDEFQGGAGTGVPAVPTPA